MSDIVEEVVEELEELGVSQVVDSPRGPPIRTYGNHAAGDDEIVDEFDGAPGATGRLSGDSWVSVVSEYEGDQGENAENLLFASVEEEPKKEKAGNTHAANQMLQLSRVQGKSVLDCVIDILRGTRVLKKKSFMRTGERWIWLGEDLMSLCWKSKKKMDEHGRVNLIKVRKLKVIDLEMVLTSTDNKQLSLTFNSKEDMLLWLTGLACLIPKSAKVSQDNAMFSERINYDPMKDAWRGKLVSSRKHVNEYILLGGIGKGSFGKVKLALSRKDKRFYAVKIITTVRKGVGTRDVTADAGPLNLDSREEQAVMKKLVHPNICRNRDVLYDEADDRFILVIEYMSRGVVMDSSKLEGVKPLSEDGVREIMRDVVCGLEYMHFQEMVHRDIKPDNLLRAGDGTVKLGDFGEAKIYNLKGASQASKPSAPGTPAFLAPELCLSEKAPRAPAESYAADIWSLGATIYYMVFGRAPFLAKSVFEIHEAICTQKLTFPRGPGVTAALKDLLNRMMTKEPSKRATLDEVKTHKWFIEPVVQKIPLKKYKITQEDTDNAIQPAIWKYPED
ncbi:Serine/threonine-protein kinase ssp1 [Porphyridium purpureum]|uniref:Serine/threonine-protein kinase ssp1 n=1 Tax=Porphyridium purpureum TaxID=35688 RepID=A0A5J4Z3C6_PORPP|nr:Serine/threonine-protein kinase ssp1 [Porphyridium purpureum]|eukprot:POR1225..scf295_1